MKQFKTYLAVAALTASLGVSAQDAVNLPVVSFGGREYYAYKVQGGDSVFGICNRYHWDADVLIANNKGADGKIKKGQTLYYPTGAEADNITFTKPKTADVTREPISHEVKRGETVYGIAGLYGVSIDDIYNANPASRQGIKAGETLVIPQDNKPFLSGQTIFYTIKSGDTLYALAGKFNSSVESIMLQNPGISERNFRAGAVIKITPDTAKPIETIKTVNQDVVKSFVNYQVQKNDTWASIAAAMNLPEEELRSANPAITALKKGAWLTVPQMETISVEQTVFEQDPVEATQAGRDALYEKVHNLNNEEGVNVTLVLDNPSKKNNIDFTRGFLMGVDSQKKAGYKINMRVLDASAGEIALRQDSLLTASNLIIGVYDENFPNYLAELGRENSIEVVNVLDTKSLLYNSNPQMIQILQPVDYFNSVLAQFFADRFSSARLIMVGEPDAGDSLAETLVKSFDPSDVIYLSDEELKHYPFEGTDKYLVYSFATKKDGIESTLDALAEIRNQYPAARISTVGRPIWIGYAESLEEKMAPADTYIPSRFYLNPKGEETERFNKEFKQWFGVAPAKSYPQYSILGYDVANFFLPTTAANGGDYNVGLTHREGMQNDIDLKRLNTWSGFINSRDFVIHITPSGNYERIEVQ